MKRILIICILAGMTGMAIAQKSRVLSVFQMIEAGKYEEAKEAIELAVWNDKTSRWQRTYYAKGLLCQKAFEAGFQNNDSKKTNLYPDQLVVAYQAYEKALGINSRNRIASSIATQYYGLANSFQKQGERYFSRNEFSKAFESFEHALLISKNPLLFVGTDTSLVYNTALAAYEAGNWEKAISYLTGLNDDAYSPNVALLLYHAHVNHGDSLMAEQVLFEGEDRYKSEETIVLQLVDLLMKSNRSEKAIEVLDRAISRRPGDYHFPWTLGLVYQQMNQYEKAISNLTLASDLAPKEFGIFYDLGVCYYNMGVTLNESARMIKDNMAYQEARQQALDQFREAVSWFEKALELEPGNQRTLSKLHQLYYRLQMTEKRKSIEGMIR